MNDTFPGCAVGDVETNRRGRLTPSHALRAVWRELVGLAFGLGFIAVWASFAANSGNALFAVFAVALACMTLWKLTRLAVDILSGRVEVREGKVQKRINDDGEGGRSYFLVIDGKHLPVTKAGFTAVADGERCRVYFLPYTGWVVNCEVLGGNRVVNAPVSLATGWYNRTNV